MSKSVGCEKSFIYTLRERLSDCFLQTLNSSVGQYEVGTTSNHLFTNIFQPERYLCNSLFKSYRDILVKFKLKVTPIYMHSKKFTPNADITCPLCKQYDETEAHFVFDCITLEVLRRAILPQHLLNHRNIRSLNTIMSHDEYAFDLSKYLYNAFKIRSNLLLNKGS